MENRIEKILNFPMIYTFKIVGDNSSEFISGIEHVVKRKEILGKTKNLSRSGKYISFGITVEVDSYEELKSYYTVIKNIKGLKYYL